MLSFYESLYHHVMMQSRTSGATCGARPSSRRVGATAGLPRRAAEAAAPVKALAHPDRLPLRCGRAEGQRVLYRDASVQALHVLKARQAVFCPPSPHAARAGRSRT